MLQTVQDVQSWSLRSVCRHNARQVERLSSDRKIPHREFLMPLFYLPLTSTRFGVMVQA